MPNNAESQTGSIGIAYNQGVPFPMRFIYLRKYEIQTSYFGGRINVEVELNNRSVKEGVTPHIWEINENDPYDKSYLLEMDIKLIELIMMQILNITVLRL